MDHVKEFLDTSTIHGLSWISGTRKWSRYSWILIVIGGFSGAGYLIYTSFHNWEQSPISTTIETMPISQIKFPNVTVCPPRNSFLNLNYDFKQSENIEIENNTRKELLDYALDLIQDEFYKEMMTNLSKIEDPDRYYYWYHGYTKIEYPINNHYIYPSWYHKFYYKVETSATSGNISTQYFEDQFDANKVDGHIYIDIEIHVPPSVVGDKNTTIIFNIEKRTMKEVSDNDNIRNVNNDVIDADLNYWSENITAPTADYHIKLNRKVTADDIYNMDPDMMPGFRLTWNYNRNIEPVDIYSNLTKTKQFVR